MLPTDLRNASIRVAPGESPESWRAALADPRWLERATTLKAEGRNWVKRATLRVGGVDRDVVIKRREVHGPLAVVKLRLGDSQFARHWRKARWLLRNGFATATPFVLVTRSRGLQAEAVLVLEALPGKTVLQHLADRDLTVKQEHAVAAALGKQLTRLRMGRRWNRDHKPSNLLVTNPGPEGARIAILDCVAIRLASPFSLTSERMLTSLIVEPIGTGHRPRRAVMCRVIRAFYDEGMRWRRPSPGTVRQAHVVLSAFWNGTRRRVERHGDPAPRTNPLAPPSPRPSAR